MSNTVLEAMACGLPLVVTSVGGNPEMVSHGENGFLFASGDGRALALHIESLIANPELRVELGRKSRLRAVQLFSLDRTMREYRNLYQNLAVERGIQVGDKS
jgi:glycosyltransferase involved in cell wall biosynthesis